MREKLRLLPIGTKHLSDWEEKVTPRREVDHLPDIEESKGWTKAERSRRESDSQGNPNMETTRCKSTHLGLIGRHTVMATGRYMG